MAKIQCDGLKDLEKQLKNNIKQIQNIEKLGVYEGAKVIADEVNKQIDSIPSQCLLNGREREDLHKGLSVSKHQVDNDGISAYISFAGYNNWADGPSPGGEPILLIARSVSKGSSLRKGKYKFVGKAVSAKKTQAQEACINKIENEINKNNK